MLIIFLEKEYTEKGIYDEDKERILGKQSVSHFYRISTDPNKGYYFTLENSKWVDFDLILYDSNMNKLLSSEIRGYESTEILLLNPLEHGNLDQYIIAVYGYKGWGHFTLTVNSTSLVTESKSNLLGPDYNSLFISSMIGLIAIIVKAKQRKKRK